MHPESRDFTLFVKQILTDFFIQKLVLDVGSEDNKSNNWFLFDKDCEYHCSDVDLPFKNNTFDTIISTECFEQDPDKSLVKIYNMLKPDGLFCFTCTLKNTAPPCDLYKIIGKDILNYNNNITEINTNNLFTVWDTYYNPSTKDLYFVGIKKGNTIFESLIKYKNNGFVNISSNITKELIK